jgi:hypothetical protein
MASTLRLYMDAFYAVTVMASVGIVSGFATALFTGSTERGLQAALAMFAVTGALLIVRLWRVTRNAKATADSVATKSQDYC